jgi:outer membrane receptor for ferrienterochelin and colicin
MPKTNKLFQKKVLVTCILAGLASNIASAQQADPEIEEVIVTGSLIRGTPLDAPSPVQIIDRTAIEVQGASQLWDVIKNMEINQGSTTEVGSSNASTSSAGTANINLRNLGTNSTLTLINGKRVTPVAGLTEDGS